MFNSIIGNAGTSFDSEEQVPRSSPPWIWVGFVFAGAFFFIGVLAVVLETFETAPDTIKALNAILVAIGIGSFIYWLFCVYRLHKIMAQLTDGRYSISPGEAALKHIIPILGLIWIFQWPAALSDYLNERGRVKMISGHLIGAMLLLSLLLRYVDGAIGTVALFGVTLYISAKQKKHIKALKEATASDLPPLPDPRIFGQPVESNMNPVQPVTEGQLAE